MKISPVAWQKKALDEFRLKFIAGNTDFVMVAGTGCGKTYAGSFCLDYAMSDYRRKGENPYLVIVVPNRAIKRGWVKALKKLNYSVSGNAAHVLDKSLDGLVITYQSMKTLLPVISKLGRKLLTTFDEFHHMEVMQEWGSTAQQYLGNGNVVNRLFLSGTPWHESGKLAMVAYKETDQGLVVESDFSYTYGDNLREENNEDTNVVKVAFERFHATATTNVYDKETNQHVGEKNYATETSTMSETITPYVDFWGSEDRSLNQFPVIRRMLDEAQARLESCRQDEGMPWAGGMVVCKSINDAKLVAEYIGAHNSLLVTSEDAKALDLINGVKNPKTKEMEGGFVNNHQSQYPQWLITVEMISEGVDIPRLKVGVDLTNKLTMMHILQRWGRFLRRMRNAHGEFYPKQHAYIFILKHKMLEVVADSIEEEIEQAMKTKGPGGEAPENNTRQRTREVTGEQSDAVFSGEQFVVKIAHFAQWLWASDYDGIRAGATDYAQVLHTAEWMIKQIERGLGQYPAAYEAPTPYDADGDINAESAVDEEETYEEKRAGKETRKEEVMGWLRRHVTPYSIMTDRGSAAKELNRDMLDRLNLSTVRKDKIDYETLCRVVETAEAWAREEGFNG